MRKILLSALCGLVSGLARAQSSPFVDEKTEQALVNELSGDLAFETLRITTQWHKPSGSRRASSPWPARSRRAPRPRGSRTCAGSTRPPCTSTGPAAAPRPGCSRAQAPARSRPRSPPTPTSRPRSPTTRGRRTSPPSSSTWAPEKPPRTMRARTCAARSCSPTAVRRSSWSRPSGSAALSGSSPGPRRASTISPTRRTRWAGTSVPETDGPKGEKTTFAIVISAREGKALSDRMSGEGSRRWGAGGEGSASAPLRLRVVVDSVVLPEKKTAMVEARIPGTDPSLPEVVLTAHLQEEKFSANDDQSGVASMLEIGRALTRLIAEGKLPRPRREHPVLVGRRDLLRVPVLRRPPRRGEEVPRQPQPGHGRSEAVGGASHAVHGAHAVGRALVPLRRPAEHPRGGRPGEQRLSRRLAGAVAGAGAGLLEADLFPSRHARALPRRGRSLLRLHGPPRVQRSVGPRAGNVADELAGRIHPLLRGRPLADRPDAAQAQRVRRRRHGLVARQRRRAGRSLSRFLRRGARRRAHGARSGHGAGLDPRRQRQRGRPPAGRPGSPRRLARRSKNRPSRPRARSAPPRNPRSPPPSRRFAPPGPTSLSASTHGRPPKTPCSRASPGRRPGSRSRRSTPGWPSRSV